jgi:hypothetical protein
LDTQPQLGRRNIIINGDFKVSQRGDYSTAPVSVSSGYMVDRWTTWRNVITTDFQRLTAVIDGVTKNTFKVTATSTGTGYIGVRQLIEQQNIPAGQTVTLSCWMRSNSPYARIRQNSIDNSNNNSAVHGGDGVWRKITQTVTNVSNASIFEVGVITFAASTVPVTTGDYIEFTEFQVEFGSVATPFEHRSYGEELALCQRYYFRKQYEGAGTHLGQGRWESSYAAIAIHYPQQMRALPTFATNAVNMQAVRPRVAWHNVTGIDSVHKTGLLSCEIFFSTASSGENEVPTQIAFQASGGYFEADAEL